MKHLFKLFAIFTIASFVIVACSDEEESPTDTGDNGEDNEYIAEASDFDGYSDWTVLNTAQGPDPALGPNAHGGNDTTVTRTIYINDDVNRENGEYPKGTIVFKVAVNPDSSYEAYTAMVKRGGDFNSDANDWEWLMLTPDGQIAQNEDGEPVRGALPNCINCHNQASSTDFVFSGN